MPDHTPDVLFVSWYPDRLDKAHQLRFHLIPYKPTMRTLHAER
jgi:hypothetical protein